MKTTRRNFLIGAAAVPVAVVGVRAVAKAPQVDDVWLPDLEKPWEEIQSGGLEILEVSKPVNRQFQKALLREARQNCPYFRMK